MKDRIYQTLCERHTKEVQDQLLKGRVAIAGLGGLGSTVAVALTRIGVGHLHLIDYDLVDLSNLNRQQYRLKDIGKPKTECLKEILADINPYLDVRIDTVKICENNVKELFEEDDIICEAFDRPEEKSMLIDAVITHSTKQKRIVCASGMAGFSSSNEIHTRKLSEQIYLCGDLTSGIETGNHLMAPRVGICACHEANMIVRLLLGQEEA